MRGCAKSRARWGQWLRLGATREGPLPALPPAPIGLESTGLGRGSRALGAIDRAYSARNRPVLANTDTWPIRSTRPNHPDGSADRSKNVPLPCQTPLAKA